MLEFAAAGFQGFQKCTKHAVPSELITMPHGARGGRMFIYVLLNTCQPWVMVSVDQFPAPITLAYVPRTQVSMKAFWRPGATFLQHSYLMLPYASSPPYTD